MFRTHGKKTPREPWAFSEETSKLTVELIGLRQKLIPYIYSAAYETYRKGIPMMRALYMEHPEVEKSYEIGDEYFFGSSMLACPVVESVKKQPVKEIYLPEGLWYDFKTLKPFESGVYHIEPQLDYMPVYLKAGCVVPLEGELIVTESAAASQNEHYVWYLDDGETNNYLKGEYEEIDMWTVDDKLFANNVKEEKTLLVKYAKTNGEVITKEITLTQGDNTINLI